MCGRYSLFVPPEDLADTFDVDVADYEPRYNAAPSQSLPVIPDGTADAIQHMEWGLVPSWATSRDEGGHINARGESLLDTPSFSGAFQRETSGSLAAGRCLVPADGFYEWTDVEGRRQPYRVTLADEQPFAMAGLWAQWKPATTQAGLDSFTDDGGGDRGDGTLEPDVVETFAIVTTEPNDVVGNLHDRMAVVLDPAAYLRWLSDPVQEVQELLSPYPSEAMRAYPVSRAVNDPTNDSPEVVQPLDTDGSEAS
jgi:putative SOS response-associated peptidase YedK